jgi:ubiquinone/menaquinone biosynthesis C-methylase UbiE
MKKNNNRRTILAENYRPSDSHLNKVKQFHDQDAQQYAEMRYHTNSCEGIAYITRRQLVLDFLPPTPKKVLDIGCGPGILTKDLLAKGYAVYSSDLSIEMIRQAKLKTAQCKNPDKVFFSVNDASNLPFATNQIDTVLCIGVMYYIEDYQSVLSEIHRVLKPGGEAIIQVNKMRWPKFYKRLVPLYQRIKSKVTGKQYDKIKFHFNFFDYRQFTKDVVKEGFRLEQFEYFDFRLPFIDVLVPKLSISMGKFMFKKRRLILFQNFAFGLLMKISRANE